LNGGTQLKYLHLIFKDEQSLMALEQHEDKQMTDFLCEL